MFSFFTLLVNIQEGLRCIPEKAISSSNVPVVLEDRTCGTSPLATSEGGSATTEREEFDMRNHRLAPSFCCSFWSKRQFHERSNWCVFLGFSGLSGASRLQILVGLFDSCLWVRLDSPGSKHHWFCGRMAAVGSYRTSKSQIFSQKVKYGHLANSHRKRTVSVILW